MFDTETTTDTSQRLTFGSYRTYDRNGRLRQEGLFYADDLRSDELATLERYCESHDDDRGGQLRLMTRSKFLADVFWPIAYKAHGRVVGFNLPFDLSRIAHGWRRSRDGGFTLRLYPEYHASGRSRPHQYRPEIAVKAYGPKRQFIRFTTPARIDSINRGNAGPFRGRFVDCHTLAYALTDRSLSLAGAAAVFGLASSKAEVSGHGAISEAYIDYNRQDVRVTYELFLALTDELGRHPIDLAAEAAASPAAVSKGYLRAIGITPPIERVPAIPDGILGAAMTAYYGGRAECRMRLTPMPVRYVDFTSMYPTVFSLFGLWDWVVADHFEATDETADVKQFVELVNREMLLDRELLSRVGGVFCRVRPSGELLSVRAPYGADPHVPSGSAWTIGLNPFTSLTDMWFTLADVVVAKLLGGAAPEILKAVRVRPIGRLPNLRSILLRGSIAVDPATDLFRRAIEQRQRLRGAAGLERTEADRTAGFLKTFANSGSYGIFAEYHQLDPKPEGARVEAHGLWPISATVRTPEEPGEFCFPPLASTITAGARLLLALLQASVESRGGTYVACDTDSLLIVASASGGLVSCPGGPLRTDSDEPAVLALSFAEVDEILVELNRLNPFEATVVPSLVKIERENADTVPGLGPLQALAISAKRYALYRQGLLGPVIVKASNHGLGLYRAPMSRGAEWTEAWPAWVDHAWQSIIRDAEGLPSLQDPEWLDLPALSLLPVSSPHAIGPFEQVERGRPYADRTKPFSFMLLGHADPLFATSGRVVPIRAFEAELTRAVDGHWVNRVTGSTIGVTTRPRPARGQVRLRTFRDVLIEYGQHPEHKSADVLGGPARRSSRGLLPRQPIEVLGVPRHIGKESNRLDEVAQGAILESDDVYTQYRDERQEWAAALPTLRSLRDQHGWRSLSDTSGLSERAVRYALNGGRVPHRRARSLLVDRADQNAHVGG